MTRDEIIQAESELPNGLLVRTEKKSKKKKELIKQKIEQILRDKKIKRFAV